ncbi:hypothetical protein JZM10_01965 [Providencia rettgeri]|uniref:HEPN domain-containing protein n=1 Tax=Providencia rettgeri TaxID=587 RepID=UPI001981D081|nr:HEPN domain-containing protein [Providencia rettgeri]MBN6350233.1 hypothetical protein [Providencia rettgeri]
MDVLKFFSELIKALAWPMATIILVILLRKPVVELIPLLRRLKYKEFELEFSKEVSELKAEVEAIAKEKSPSVPVSSSRLLDLVSFSTPAAIMEAWLEVESAAISTASSFWGQSTNDALKNTQKLGEYLLQCKVIDREQLDIFNKLRHLRNKVAHARDLNLSESDARSYVQLALDLADSIRGTKV